ncbi:hypothetical protein ACFWSF_37635 [Streptomyces sp. NPDC058611]|uniref:hypothetical protein n=1 Tax=unclassified Streptomyces TaxID=2593676 RepID=UPI003650ED0E
MLVDACSSGVTFDDSTFLNLLLTLSSACGLRLTGPLPRRLVRLDGHGYGSLHPSPAGRRAAGLNCPGL